MQKTDDAGKTRRHRFCFGRGKMGICFFMPLRRDIFGHERMIFMFF